MNAFIVREHKIPRLSATSSLPLENVCSAAELEAWTGKYVSAIAASIGNWDCSAFQYAAGFSSAPTFFFCRIAAKFFLKCTKRRWIENSVQKWRNVWTMSRFVCRSLSVETFEFIGFCDEIFFLSLHEQIGRRSLT